MGTNGVGKPSLGKAPGKTNSNSTINRETGVIDRRPEHEIRIHQIFQEKTMFLFGCFLSVFAMTGPVLGVVSQEKPQSPPVAGSASQEKPQPSPDDLFVPPDSPIPDIDFSILNQKFRLMDLARDIAESMKNEPTETKFEKNNADAIWIAQIYHVESSRGRNNPAFYVYYGKGSCPEISIKSCRCQKPAPKDCGNDPRNQAGPAAIAHIF